MRNMNSGGETPETRKIAALMLGTLAGVALVDVAFLASGNLGAAAIGTVALGGGAIVANKINDSILESGRNS